MQVVVKDDCYQLCQKMDFGFMINDFVCLTSDSLTTLDMAKPIYVVSCTTLGARIEDFVTAPIVP